MKTTLLLFRLFPSKTSAILADLRSNIHELRDNAAAHHRLANEHFQTADQYQKDGDVARSEANVSNRVADKLETLLS